MFHFFTHSSVEGILACFHFLTLMTKAAVNIVVQVSLLYGEVFSRCMPRKAELGLKIDSQSFEKKPS